MEVSMEMGLDSSSDVFLYLYLAICNWAGNIDSASTFQINCIVWTSNLGTGKTANNIDFFIRYQWGPHSHTLSNTTSLKYNKNPLDILVNEAYSF